VPKGAHYAEGAAARDIIERSGKVIACVAGHTHWNARNTMEVATIVQPDTILGWNRKLAAEKFDGSKQRQSLGDPVSTRNSKSRWFAW
jgi:hypothetical protein